MSMPRIVVDNSAIIPFYFPERESSSYDAGLVNNRSRALVAAIRLRRVQALVPPSFYREILNVAVRPIFDPGGCRQENISAIRAQWEDLLILPLQTSRLEQIIGLSGQFVFEEKCPAPDAWYVATAKHADATFWMSHDHADGLFAVASQHVTVKLLSDDTPNY
jgi:predicted nucleic acid-binding protein